MNDSKNKFLRRIFLYRLQYPVAGIVVLFVLALFSSTKLMENEIIIFVCFSLFNTITYFCSTYLANRYGIEMFGDLDQPWLEEHQAFDSKAFGEIFARLIHCRKIAGPYMMAVIVPLAFINIGLATIVGIAYLIGYFIYRMTYLDIAISYKIPRAFGNSILVSKILGDDSKKKPDNSSNKPTKK